MSSGFSWYRLRIKTSRGTTWRKRTIWNAEPSTTLARKAVMKLLSCFLRVELTFTELTLEDGTLSTMQLTTDMQNSWTNFLNGRLIPTPWETWRAARRNFLTTWRRTMQSRRHSTVRTIFFNFRHLEVLQRWWFRHGQDSLAAGTGHQWVDSNIPQHTFAHRSPERPHFDC